MNTRALSAEFIGTFMLVFSIIAVALFQPPSGPNLAVPLSVGITVMGLAYALGPISGGHFNPAVTLGLVAAGRFEASQSIGYIIAQCLGAIAAAAAVYLIATGNPDAKFSVGNFASNGFGYKGVYSMTAVVFIEALLTAFFLIVIVGATSSKASPGFAPIAIGLTLGAIHLMAIPVSNCSVNPARSLAAALFGGSLAISQVWVFFVAPILGGVVGGLIARYLHDE
ncbi:MAG: aquaporin [Hyphomicrobiaceae bacterium]|nr:aquaporin [Hyphomicrobiaceae bacterium]